MDLTSLPIDLFIQYITYLPFDSVVNICNTNKTLHNKCTDSKYNTNWRVLINETFGNIYDYKLKLRQIWKKFGMTEDTYNYIVYTRLINYLDPITQLMIYYRQGDQDNFYSDRFNITQRDAALSLLGEKETDYNLSWMIKQGNIRGIKHLLDKGADLNSINFGNFTLDPSVKRYLENLPKPSDKILIDMAIAAANSSRADQIFKPFPEIYSENKDEILLDPANPDYDLVRQLLSEIGTGSDYLTDELVKWITTSNSVYRLAKLPVRYQISSMNTPEQYILINTGPEEKFDERKQKYGSVYGFHGSSNENWYSIFKQGLKNASGTELEAHGTIQGDGIYFAGNAATALRYSSLKQVPWKGLILAEIIDKEQYRRSNNVWVVADANDVNIKFFFVYRAPDSNMENIENIGTINSNSPEFQNEFNNTLEHFKNLI